MQDKPIPPASKKESEAPTNWDDMSKANKFRKQHDELTADAFSISGDPYHFETLMNFSGHLFSEPMDKQEIKMQREAMKKAERERVLKNLESFWSGDPATGPDVPDEEQ